MTDDTNTKETGAQTDNAQADQTQPDTTSTQHNQVRTTIGALVFLCISALLGIWVMQQSVNAYILQTYHTPSPLTHITHPLWLKGGEIGTLLYAHHDDVAEQIGVFNEAQVAHFNEHFAYTSAYKQQMMKKTQEEAERLAQENAKKQEMLRLNAQEQELQALLTVNSSQKVFFAGDSMMQGIAPHIQKHLQGFGIQSINLSRQSTGLAYPKFFDWQSTIKDTIKKDSTIKVLIVMLGPNDPWDMPASNGRYLKFNSPEWDSEYQSRIADILNFATEHHVGVIWVTPPNMKKPKLNEQMIHLNAVIQQELARHNVKMIDSRPIMGGVNDSYNDYLVKDANQIKMRSSDGIHFSPEGQKILAQAVWSHLIIQ